MGSQGHGHSHGRADSYSPLGNDYVIQRMPLLGGDEEKYEEAEWETNGDFKTDIEHSHSRSSSSGSHSSSGYNTDINRNNWIRIDTRKENISYIYEDKDDPTDKNKESQLFPKEKKKTFLSLTFMAVMFLVNVVSIALTHDRVPDRNTVAPLPDIILDNITTHPELMKLPDILVMIGLYSGFALLLLHSHRWILARRMFFIVGVLYMMRSFTMYVTVLPVANYTVHCDPKSNATSALEIAGRALKLLSGFGLQISGKKNFCGDYIYSGHTVMLLTSMLMIKEYSPKRLWPLHWFSWAITWSGMGILLLARGHYTIDVLIGYFAATRMFWAYHTLANNTALKVASPTNFHSEVWWFRIFQYLEGNVGGPLPRRYSFPISIRFLSWRKVL